MFNSKKLKTRPANYAASHAINFEEDWTRRGKRRKEEKGARKRGEKIKKKKKRKRKERKEERRRDPLCPP